MTKLLPFLFVVMLIFATALFVDGVVGFLDLARHSAPTGLASSSATPASAIPSTALPLKGPPAWKAPFPGREADPDWQPPNPVLSELESRAADATSALAMRDGFFVRLVRCNPRGSLQLCDICYSHPQGVLGAALVVCSASDCQNVTFPQEMVGVDLSFCETH